MEAETNGEQQLDYSMYWWKWQGSCVTGYPVFWFSYWQHRYLAGWWCSTFTIGILAWMPTNGYLQLLMNTAALTAYWSLTKNGKLRRLYCPFKVLTNYTFSHYKVGTLVDVLAVKVTPDLLMVYLVGQVAYPYYLFKIMGWLYSPE